MRGAGLHRLSVMVDTMASHVPVRACAARRIASAICSGELWTPWSFSAGAFRQVCHARCAARIPTPSPHSDPIWKPRAPLRRANALGAPRARGFQMASSHREAEEEREGGKRRPGEEDGEEKGDGDSPPVNPAVFMMRIASFAVACSRRRCRLRSVLFAQKLERIVGSSFWANETINPKLPKPFLHPA